MLCEMAELPFQANANYGNWSIDFKVSPYWSKLRPSSTD